MTDPVEDLLNKMDRCECAHPKATHGRMGCMVRMVSRLATGDGYCPCEKANTTFHDYEATRQVERDFGTLER